MISFIGHDINTRDYLFHLLNLPLQYHCEQGVAISKQMTFTLFSPHQKS